MFKADKIKLLAIIGSVLLMAAPIRFAFAYTPDSGYNEGMWPAISTSTDTSDFDSALSSLDITAQKAFDTIDDAFAGLGLTYLKLNASNSPVTGLLKLSTGAHLLGESSLAIGGTDQATNAVSSLFETDGVVYLNNPFALMTRFQVEANTKIVGDFEIPVDNFMYFGALHSTGGWAVYDSGSEALVFGTEEGGTALSIESVGGILASNDLYPAGDGIFSLGKTGQRWSDLWLAGQLTNGTVTLSVANIANKGITSPQTFSGQLGVLNTGPTFSMTDSTSGHGDISWALNADILTLAANDASNDIIFTYTMGTTRKFDLNSGVSTTFSIAAGLEATLTANTLTFENGASDTSIGWATTGQMDLTATLVNIIGGLQVDSITNDTGLAHGTYTPTRSAEANITGTVTMSEAQYMRVGNTVTVSGRFTADPTLAVTATSFQITLPVASNIGAVEDLAGVASSGKATSMVADVLGVVASDTAIIQWISSDITVQDWSYAFTYQVI